MGARKKVWIGMILVLCMTSAISLAVYAYLSKSSGALSNSFEADVIPTLAIGETFDGYVKENVTVSVGNPEYAVYVRAVIVVTWQDAAGNILAQQPLEGVDYDYSIALNAGDGKLWFYRAADGFYYYRAMISGGETAPLIQSCRQLKPAPKDGYSLHVEVIAQTIQALGTTDVGDVPAVTDAWGVTVTDGELTP